VASNFGKPLVTVAGEKKKLMSSPDYIWHGAKYEVTCSTFSGYSLSILVFP